MGTLVGFLIVAVILGAAIWGMVKDKKNGKSLHCGGDCKNCGGHCH